jgi:hypothetical protein
MELRRCGRKRSERAFRMSPRLHLSFCGIGIELGRFDEPRPAPDRRPESLERDFRRRRRTCQKGPSRFTQELPIAIFIEANFPELE